MDKEEATKVLAAELVKANGQKFVTDPAYKKHLLETAVSHCYIEHCKPFSLKTENYWTHSEKYLFVDDVHERCVESHKKKIVEYCSKVSDANYVFVEHSENVTFNEKYSLFSLTDVFSFFALIGEREAKDIRRLFYKDVQSEVISAMDALGIEHFASAYQIYKNSNKFFENKGSNNFFEVLDALSVGEKFINFVSKLKYDGDGEVRLGVFEEHFNGIRTLNNTFKKLGMDSLISTVEYRKSSLENPGYIHQKNLLEVVNQLQDITNRLRRLRDKEGKKYELTNDFFNFVFSLPYEEQNIESNKDILKYYPKDLDLTSILAKEYSNGKYFQEYFDILNQESQYDIILALKNIPNRNPIHDSFLWSKGFKDIDLDYLRLYKNDSKTFIEYFSNRGVAEKEVILKDVMGCDFINGDVVKWLNENEFDLIRKVGLNG